MSDMNWNPFDPSLMKQAAERAEEQSIRRNFGKLTVGFHYMKFVDTGDKLPSGKKKFERVDVTPAEYVKAAANKETGYALEVNFTVDPSEFSPSASFLYERKVSVQPGKKTDWMATVYPSILVAFGSLDEFNRRMSGRESVYVEVEDAPQQTDPKYSVIKFVRLFKDLAECKTAWAAKYGGNPNGNGHALPADVVNTVLLLKRAIKDTAQLQATIKADPTLNQYAFEDLMKVG